MAEELVENAEFGKKRKNEEDPILIAQRYLNIYRQMHIFNQNRQDEFDRELLALSPEIKILLSTLPGGGLLLEHIEETAEKLGIESVNISNKKVATIRKKDNSDLQSSAPANPTVSANSNIPMDANLANDLSSLSMAIQQTEQRYKEDMQTLTKTITDSIMESQMAMANMMKEVLLAARGFNQSANNDAVSTFAPFPALQQKNNEQKQNQNANVKPENKPNTQQKQEDQKQPQKQVVSQAKQAENKPNQQQKPAEQPKHQNNDVQQATTTSVPFEQPKPVEQKPVQNTIEPLKPAIQRPAQNVVEQPKPVTQNQVQNANIAQATPAEQPKSQNNVAQQTTTTSAPFAQPKPVEQKPVQNAMDPLKPAIQRPAQNVVEQPKPVTQNQVQNANIAQATPTEQPKSQNNIAQQATTPSTPFAQPKPVEQKPVQNATEPLKPAIQRPAQNITEQPKPATNTIITPNEEIKTDVSAQIGLNNKPQTPVASATPAFIRPVTPVNNVSTPINSEVQNKQEVKKAQTSPYLNELNQIKSALESENNNTGKNEFISLSDLDDLPISLDDFDDLLPTTNTTTPKGNTPVNTTNNNKQNPLSAEPKTTNGKQEQKTNQQNPVNASNSEDDEWEWEYVEGGDDSDEWEWEYVEGGDDSDEWEWEYVEDE